MRFLPAILAGAAFLTAGACASAQVLRAQPTPFSVWLDFDTASGAPTAAALPIWLESVIAEKVEAKADAEEQTVFRIRLRHFGELSRELQLRLFFDDLPGVSPVVTGWTETGTQRWTSGPLGEGLGLPSSDTLIIPTDRMDYLEVTVPGKGRTVRGVFLSSVKLTETRFALDFASPAGFSDPFGGAPAAAAPVPETDSWLLGRVKAVLEPGPLKVASLKPATWDFQLDRVPSLAVLHFEILGADLEHPPEAALNGQALGVVSLQLPDLADPAFHGEAIADRHYRYDGWLPAQLLVPVAGLQVGVNELDLVVSPRSSAVAIRTVELQLKYPSR